MKAFWAVTALWLAPILSAQSWQTSTNLPDVDVTGLSDSVKSAALKMIREQDCNCGCSLKIAECRVKDPKCSYSRTLANAVVKEFAGGKSVDQAYATLRELQKQGPERPKVLEDPVPLTIAGAPVMGPAQAKITIVEFSDFQCPYCAVAAKNVRAVMAAYPNDVRVVFKQFPLDFHSAAYMAAEAALAAHAQGKFWALHDKMFANYRQLSRENVARWASEAGLDMKAFQGALAAKKFPAVIDKELKEGEAAGVMGTPTFFINGKRYNGPFELQALKPILDAELKGQPLKAALQ